MTTWSTVTWDVARASGFTAFVLLTLAVVLGLALSMRWQRPTWPRLITNDLHSYLTLLSLVFLVIHVLASWLDPFMGFKWTELVIPFASHYRPIYMALGIVGAYLAIAVWVSTQLRSWIGHTWWRRLHGLSFGAYVLALFHGIGMGSDTRTVWAIAFYAGSALLVGALLFVRLITPIGARGRAYPNLATLTALLFVGGAVWTVHGPLQPGWNAVANNGQGSGSRLQASSAQTTQAGVPAPAQAAIAPFTATVQGTASESQPDAAGAVTVDVATTLGGGAQGTMDVRIQGQPAADGSIAVTGTQVTLTLSGAGPYQGQTADFQSSNGEWQLSVVLQGTDQSTATLQARVSLSPTTGDQVQGAVEVTPSAA